VCVCVCVRACVCVCVCVCEHSIKVMNALFCLQIIDPRYGYRDAAFPPLINEQLPSVEYQVSSVVWLLSVY